MSEEQAINRIAVVCEKCGKEAPHNEKMSNENWQVFMTDRRCECGGEFIPSIKKLTKEQKNE